MFDFFKRLFKLAEAEGHSIIEEIEDPIKMSEQAMRDLKKDLNDSLQNLAQAKAITISMRRQLEEQKQISSDYEKKAMLLLGKVQSGELDANEGERLAAEAVAKRDQALQSAAGLSQNVNSNEALTGQLESKIGQLRQQLSSWSNEMITLKARAKVAQASKKINKQLALVDSNSTIALLERMKTKVNEEESLATAYGELSDTSDDLDKQINRALLNPSPSSSEGLKELKQRMGLKELPSSVS